MTRRDCDEGYRVVPMSKRDPLLGEWFVPCPTCAGPRPLDYVWNGQRVTHYLNHGVEWHGCPATEANHHTLRADR